MKISYENLKKVYEVMKGVINKKGYEIVKGVLFQGENATGSDADMISAKVYGICENGNNVIPLDEIANMLKVFEKGNVIEISNGEAKANDLKIKFKEMKVEQYPKVIDTNNLTAYQIWDFEKEEIDNIRNAGECVDKQKNSDNRILKYVNVYQNGERFMIRGIDSYTLYQYESKKEDNGKESSVLLNQKLIKNIGKKVDKLKLSTYEKCVSVKWDNVELIGTTIPDKYLNTDKIMLIEMKSEVKVSKEKMMNALEKLDKVVSANMKKGNNRPITFRSDNNQLIINYVSMDNEIKIPVECKVVGKVEEMGMNCSMLLKNIGLLNGDIKISIKDYRNPIIMQNENTKILQTTVKI